MHCTVQRCMYRVFRAMRSKRLLVTFGIGIAIILFLNIAKLIWVADFESSPGGEPRSLLDEAINLLPIALAILAAGVFIVFLRKK